MDRAAFNAMLAQYATPEVSGNGRVSWNGGVRCVIPEVRLYGKCVQDGTPTPDAPVPIKCNNGVFALHGDTILDTTQLNTKDFGWISNDDKEFSSTAAYYYFEIPAKPNTAYYCIAPYAVFGKSAGVTFICVDRVAKVRNYIYHVTDKSLCKTISTITTDETGVLYLLTTVPFFADNVLRSFWLTEYCGQATAPELCSITVLDSLWNPISVVADELDAQTGKITRRVKKLVLDGTEDWVMTNAGYGTDDPYQGYSFYIPSLMNVNALIICSHFPFNKNEKQPNVCRQMYNSTKYKLRFTVSTDIVPNKTKEEWKSYLSAQYAAGTPVTVWYVLKEPEIEYVAPQRLTQPPGSGQIIQLSGDVADCLIMAKYLTHS